MSTIQWIPKKEEQATSTDTVVVVTVMAYEPQNETTAGASDENTPKTNHWCIYLETGPSSFIRADPTPTGLSPLMSMVLAVTSKKDTSTYRTHKKVRMNVAKNLTVGDFFELVTAKGYHRYQFTDTGNGCRYWVSCVVELLHDQGYLGDVDEARAALDKVWSNKEAIGSGNQTRLGKQKGTFY